MFLIFGLIFLFVIGLPLSFAIGCLIAYVVNRFIGQASKNVWIGGVLYVVAQPISMLVIVLMELYNIEDKLGFTNRPLEGFSPFEMITALVFAVVFTATVYGGIIVLKNKEQNPAAHTELER